MKVIVTTITRSPKGNPMRSSREINAEQVRIGRGAECELRLADPRVPLHARTIFFSRHGAQLYEAFEQFTDASITGVHRPQSLRPGMSVRIGPFQVDVTEPHHEADLALTVELVQPLPGKASISAQDIYEQARRSPVSKRALSWLLFAGILLFFLALPTADFFGGAPAAKPASRDARFLSDLQENAGRLAQVSWNPGQLAAGHQPFAHDCQACHSDSFTRVQDKDCRACHQNLGDHVSKESGKVPGLSDVRCASCHRDHKGEQALRTQIDHYFMGDCSACHGDIKKHLSSTKTGNATDFAQQHPQFRVGLVTGLNGATGKPDTSRVRLSDTAQLVEKRGLKFPHDVHLDPRGVKGPQGVEKMECASCHIPDGTGVRFRPVTMKQHCQSCHELRFELAAPERQVPHGNVDDVINTMREFYSYLAVNNIVLNPPPAAAGTRAPPGKPATPVRRLGGSMDVEAQVQAAATEIFERTTCFTCHDIQRIETPAAAPAWKVSPVLPATPWMAKAKFTHGKHDMVDCATCHAAPKSGHARDVLMPKIEGCRSCHAGNHPATQKITSNCGMCHGFHQAG
ncbi:MAG: hypothetical protein K0S16_936, partial [Moraxellaceae bacterium]|nr:hypothetical protein [Moraxellaceae bacterium]